MQAAHAGTTAFERYVGDLVLTQPDPPRNPSWRVLLVNSYLNRVGLILVGFGLVLGLAGVLVGIVAVGSLLERVVLIFPSVMVVVLFAGAPALRALRYFRALQRGIRVLAEIVESTWSAPGIRPPTIEAGSHGMARGVRRVLHPTAVFEEPFETDRAWASHLKAGDRLLVLADPVQPRVLIELGPMSEQPATLGES